MINDEDINEVTETAYNIKGLIAGKTEKPCAAKINIKLTNGTNQTKFQVLTHGNILFNPLGADSYKITSRASTMKVVSEKTFDYYVKFLRTKNNLYMTYANRSFIDG
tara:strand:- start:2610 stop:2930 length:321 start_codon:yes stop_codon:yes gene_type:complete